MIPIGPSIGPSWECPGCEAPLLILCLVLFLNGCLHPPLAPIAALEGSLVWRQLYVFWQAVPRLNCLLAEELAPVFVIAPASQ